MNHIKDLMFSVEILETTLRKRIKQLPHRGPREEKFPPDYVRLYHRTGKQRDELMLRLSAKKLSRMEYTLGQKIFASKTLFSKLKLTTLPKLNLDKFAKGKYILARVIEEWHPYSVVSFTTVIEDHLGHVVRFVLYNYPLDEMFSPGDVIVIKEPYLWSPVDKNPTIRCNCPTDIMVLRPAHFLYPKVKEIKWKHYVRVNDLLCASPCPTNAMECKVRGNSLFARGQVLQAREAYNIGLKMCSGNYQLSKVIRLNLLAVQFRLGYFEWVVENGEILLKKFPWEKQVYFWVGKAYHALRNYENELVTYEKFCQKFPEHKLGLIELETAKERVRESNGEFDFLKLQKITLEKPLEKIECADFCGPVKIMKISGKGRGLVLTKDVSKDSVLVVSKALVSVLNRHEYLGVSIDSGENIDWNLIKASVVTQLARLIMKNPKTIGTRVYDLYPGINYKTPAQLFCDPELKSEPISDIELLKNIIATNVYFVADAAQNGELVFRVCGLFSLPSYMNHSCVPNVRQDFYNDVMVVTALEDMKEGTELTCSYFSPELSFEQRTKLLFEKGVFRCDCAKCEKRL